MSSRQRIVWFVSGFMLVYGLGAVYVLWRTWPRQ